MHQSGTQRIVKIRRDYNTWVADETLEDYALRYTPRGFRKWSEFRVANTALGATSFLALEAIGGSLAINYGFTNAFWAIVVVSVLIFLTGLPISYYAARFGVDMDLLTRGAGFGYIGSTVTSLVYATFTFIFLALEAAIMALAVQLYVGLPLPIAYVLCSLVIIPLVTHGITAINKLQSWTQVLWLVLLVLPYAAVLLRNPRAFADWPSFGGLSESGRDFNLLAFGAGCTVAFALIVQIGEQVDYLRFLPEKTRANRGKWWLALLAAGPGWVVPGALKMLGGSFLVFLAVQHEVGTARAVEPTQMYLVAYQYVFGSPALAMAAMALFVVVSQIKINVTNAYAGSLAWSNFFARLTHSHPGRVVWLVFNVLIALLLMELGVFEALNEVLALYANVAIAWIGALVADLVINKPLGYSPAHIEFKRAYLYDVNPVGVGAMLIASVVATLAHLGLFGAVTEALSPFVALGVAFLCAPLIAVATHGQFYLARKVHAPADAEHAHAGAMRCVICENVFEREDMAQCPAYAGSICSLCCSLDARCGDACKPHGRLSAQIAQAWRHWFPNTELPRLHVRVAQYAAVLLIVLGLLAGVLTLIYYQTAVTLSADQSPLQLLARGYIKAFFALALVGCVGAWWLVLAKESRKVAQEESNRQTMLLMREIEAHRKTDAMLQQAKQAAESANRAKSRYVTGLSHELRTPLNSILGYAQLLMRDPSMAPARREGLATIFRSGEHLLALVDGLLDVARIEAGKLQLDVSQVAFPAFLTQIEAMMEPHASEKGLAFRMEHVGRIPDAVRMDEKRVRQILINLLGNAVRFTDSGTVSLRVAYARELATFEILDTGIGIASDELERIFLPFERGAAAHAQDNGAGLGLTICRMLTTLMGGQLSVDSVPGEGTRFTVRLFLPEVREPRAVDRIRHVSGYRGARRTVLVVDDQREQRRIVVGALAPLGFTLVEAASGPEAMRQLGTLPVDLIVMDVSMPSMDGFEASRLIRKQALSVAPILVLSANAFAGDRARGAAAGCDDYLAKPVHLPQLLDKVGELLNLEWIVDSEAAEEAPPPARSHAPLPAELVAQLRPLLEIGYIRGLIELLDEAEHRDPDLAGVLQPVRSAARRFRLTELDMLLKGAPSDEHSVD